MSKFSDDTCEALYDMSLDGCLDGQCGDVSAIGEWYGLLVGTGIDDANHAILREDSQGFVTYDVYDTESEARKEFERIEKEIAEENEDSEETACE